MLMCRPRCAWKSSWKYRDPCAVLKPMAVNSDSPANINNKHTREIFTMNIREPCPIGIVDGFAPARLAFQLSWLAHSDLPYGAPHQETAMKRQL